MMTNSHAFALLFDATWTFVIPAAFLRYVEGTSFIYLVPQSNIILGAFMALYCMPTLIAMCPVRRRMGDPSGAAQDSCRLLAALSAGLLIASLIGDTPKCGRSYGQWLYRSISVFQSSRLLLSLSVSTMFSCLIESPNTVRFTQSQRGDPGCRIYHSHTDPVPQGDTYGLRPRLQVPAKDLRILWRVINCH
jgi:hypothetical protein